jgi:hypothetical protein
MFASKARAYLIEALFTYVPLFSPNITLGLEGFLETNIFGLFAINEERKSFITSTTG